MTLDQVARLNLLILWPLVIVALASVVPLAGRGLRSSEAERGLVAILLGAGALLGCFALAASLLWAVGHSAVPFLVDYGRPESPWQLRLLFDRAGGLALLAILGMAGAGLFEARAELRDLRAVACFAAALALICASLVLVSLPVLALAWLAAALVVVWGERSPGRLALTMAPALATAIGLTMVSRLSGEASMVNAGPGLAFAADRALRLAGLLTVGGLALSAMVGPMLVGRAGDSARRLPHLARLAWSAAALVVLVRVATLVFGFPHARPLIAPVLAGSVTILWGGALCALAAQEARRGAGFAAAGGVGWVLFALAPVIRGDAPGTAYAAAFLVILATPALLALPRSAARPGWPLLGAVLLCAGWALAPATIGFPAVTHAFAAVVRDDPAWAWVAVAVYPLVLIFAGRHGWAWWSAPAEGTTRTSLLPLLAAAALLAGGLVYEALVVFLRPLTG